LEDGTESKLLTLFVLLSAPFYLITYAPGADLVIPTDRVMIYSNKTLQSLACLNHHRNSVQTLDFAPMDYPPSPASSNSPTQGIEDIESDSEEEDEGDSGDGRGILATGGMDMKICLWKIYPP
jgi:hypothetical protein